MKWLFAPRSAVVDAVVQPKRRFDAGDSFVCRNASSGHSGADFSRFAHLSLVVKSWTWRLKVSQSAWPPSDSL